MLADIRVGLEQTSSHHQAPALPMDPRKKEVPGKIVFGVILDWKVCGINWITFSVISQTGGKM
jgi:hypothetical protein